MAAGVAQSNLGGQPIQINDEFQRALDLIDAGSCVFITGRAGTGKSTLLHHLIETSVVPQVVLAPTGVAALNVDGQTIHRFFGFPPSVTPEQIESGELFPRRNIDVIRTVRRIIIDEVSMVRADLMDCIDACLRLHGPDAGKPFGGVQMVFVGDPYQLPPVVIDEETTYFSTNYQTPYFFSSNALESLDFETIELEQIYRQDDDEFIAILNAIRENTATPEHFDRLARNVDVDFIAAPEDRFITLTTTNALADRVNAERLDQIQGEEFQRIAEMSGDFPSQPAPADLRFKVGAQIMLLTNDPLDRWVNGTLGMILDVEEDDDFVVTVLVHDTGEVVTVEPHRWSLTQPRVTNGRLVHNDAGTFRQLPFVLAWAITIHKSQGKTFDRVIIDIGGGTRSNGQLYVALSRARSLDGIVLRQALRPKHVMVEDEVARFFARRRSGSDRLHGQRLAVIAINVTGHGRFDRIVEMAAVIVDGGSIVDEFDTMVHPLRDVTLSWEHGITASMASMSPSFAEVWAAIAPALDGCVLVSHGLAPLARQLRMDLAAADIGVGTLGIGVCTRELLRSSLADACEVNGIPFDESPVALVQARATAELVLSLTDVDAVFEPMSGLTVGHSPPRLERRPDQIDDLVREPIATTDSFDKTVIYSTRLARVLDDGRLDESERKDLVSLARTLGITEIERAVAHERFCTSMLEAATRDEEITDDEWHHISLVHSDLGVELPARPASRPDSVVELFRGMKVCFTGFPPEGADGIDTYYALARSIGLEPIKDVTKHCRLVVARDRASISSRAKKGRERGILIDLTQFLDLVEAGDVHDPPDDHIEQSAARSRKPAAPRPPRVREPIRPEDLPKNRPIGRYSLEQLVAVVNLLDPERSLDDMLLMDRCVEFLEFDQRSPQRIRKLASAIDTHRGETIGSFRARQEERSLTATASALLREHRAEDSFVPKPGMGICFTGSAILNGARVEREKLRAAAEKAGLVVCESVNRDCNVLVFADQNARSTKKVKKALEMGIKGMTVERFAQLFPVEAAE